MAKPSFSWKENYNRLAAFHRITIDNCQRNSELINRIICNYEETIKVCKRELKLVDLQFQSHQFDEVYEVLEIEKVALSAELEITELNLKNIKKWQNELLSKL